MSPRLLKPTCGPREKGTRALANHGRTASCTSVQLPSAAAYCEIFSSSTTISELHMGRRSARSPKGRAMRSNKVMTTTFFVVLAPICAPTDSACSSSGNPERPSCRSALGAWVFSASSFLRRISALTKREIRTSRRFRSSRSSLKLRPARVPRSAARAARAMGLWDSRSLAAITTRSTKIDSTATRSMKKKKLKLYRGRCSSDDATCIPHSTANTAMHKERIATATAS
mmetsp:Transcript_69038/g.199904  ORF Transcript_69038/g.199904 Transcript_69038/m.199904 type:complete len:228 (-) Transcript_69038:143-826(-)